MYYILMRMMKSFLYDMCYLPKCKNENFYLKVETGL